MNQFIATVGLLILLGKYNEAIADFNKSIELNPKNETVYNNRGSVYNELGNYNEAIADFNKSIELNPKNADVYARRGYVYNKLGNYNEVIVDYNKSN